MLIYSVTLITILCARMLTAQQQVHKERIVYVSFRCLILIRHPCSGQSKHEDPFLEM